MCYFLLIPIMNFDHADPPLLNVEQRSYVKVLYIFLTDGYVLPDLPHPVMGICMYRCFNHPRCMPPISASRAPSLSSEALDRRRIEFGSKSDRVRIDFESTPNLHWIDIVSISDQVLVEF